MFEMCSGRCRTLRRVCSEPTAVAELLRASLLLCCSKEGSGDIRRGKRASTAPPNNKANGGRSRREAAKRTETSKRRSLYVLSVPVVAACCAVMGSFLERQKAKTRRGWCAGGGTFETSNTSRYVLQRRRECNRGTGSQACRLSPWARVLTEASVRLLSMGSRRRNSPKERREETSVGSKRSGVRGSGQTFFFFEKFRTRRDKKSNKVDNFGYTASTPNTNVPVNARLHVLNDLSTLPKAHSIGRCLDQSGLRGSECSIREDLGAVLENVAEKVGCNGQIDERTDTTFSVLRVHDTQLHLYHGGGLHSRRGGMHSLQRRFHGECRLLLHGLRSTGWLSVGWFGRRKSANYFRTFTRTRLSCTYHRRNGQSYLCVVYVVTCYVTCFYVYTALRLVGAGAKWGEATYSRQSTLACQTRNTKYTQHTEQGVRSLHPIDSPAASVLFEGIGTIAGKVACCSSYGWPRTEYTNQ